MGLFGKSEYGRQLETSARQQAETQRQQIIFQQQSDEQQRQLEISRRRQEEHERLLQTAATERQRQVAEYDEQTSQNLQSQERYTKR